MVTEPQIQIYLHRSLEAKNHSHIMQKNSGYDFYCASSYASAALGVLILSVCLFVHLEVMADRSLFSDAMVTCEVKLFHRLIAAREYFPTCSLSLK